MEINPYQTYKCLGCGSELQLSAKVSDDPVIVGQYERFAAIVIFGCVECGKVVRDRILLIDPQRPSLPSLPATLESPEDPESEPEEEPEEPEEDDDDLPDVWDAWTPDERLEWVSTFSISRRGVHIREWSSMAATTQRRYLAHWNSTGSHYEPSTRERRPRLNTAEMAIDIMIYFLDRPEVRHATSNALGDYIRERRGTDAKVDLSAARKALNGIYPNLFRFEHRQTFVMRRITKHMVSIMNRSLLNRR